MRQQSMTRPRSLTGQHDGPRPPGPPAGPPPAEPGTDALGRVAARSWSLPPRRNRVAVEYDVEVPMSDGTVLLATHYIPVSVASAATVLVRCPYGRTGVFALQTGQILAERGYHVLLQSVRGTFGSGGDFEPMRHEITDGQDTGMAAPAERFEGQAAPTAPATRLRAVGAGRDPPLNWSPPWCTSARTTSAGPRRHGAFDLCTTTSCGATWSCTRRVPGCCAGWRA